MKATAPSEIAELSKLSQQAAAWLIGCTARALRDWPDAPRNPDGTYNGRELVAWNRDKLERPELTDDEYEKLLLIQEYAYEQWESSARP